jgi:hypothetical protein
LPLARKLNAREAESFGAKRRHPMQITKDIIFLFFGAPFDAADVQRAPEK